MNDRPTPMTDAESFRSCIGDWGYGEFVPAVFARTLERQLAEAKEALETIVKVASRHDWIGPAGEMDAALADCQAILANLNTKTP